MYFLIKETGERKELHYIDADTGVDCINDIIGNSGAIGDYIIYDDEAEAYWIDQGSYNWWDEYITHAQEDEQELDRLRDEYDQRDECTGQSAIDDIISRYYAPIDMDSEHNEWGRVFDIIRDELGNG